MRIIVCLAMAFSLSIHAAGTDKQAGVCFRGDDNHTPEKWNELRAVFDKHGYKLCASLNLLDGHKRKGYMEFVRDLQAGGHEVMDHTPMHRVFVLRYDSEAEAAALAEKAFVDHAVGRMVYFGYRIAPVRSAQTGKATVAGKSFRPADADAFKNWRGAPFLSFADKPEVVYLLNQNKEGGFELLSFWGEDTVNLGAEREATYRRLGKDEIRVLPEALRYQTQLVLDICKRYDVRPPTSWVQPGGSEPTLWRDDLAQICGQEFGYTAAATYPDSSRKCFNEYDPDGDRRFAMQWGNFIEDGRDLAWNKTRIADGVARHHVMFGHSHLKGPETLGGWPGTLQRTDDLLAWCKETSIPVRTMAEWADILYTQKTDPTVNVFPDIATDRDGNGRPDGILLGAGVTVEKSEAGCRLRATRDGVVCKVLELGGLEKGRNTLSVELADAVQATVTVDVRPQKMSKADQAVTLLARPDNPRVLSGIVDIPAEASVADLTVSIQGVPAGGLRLGSFSLRQLP
jgi:hypothetical protein